MLLGPDGPRRQGRSPDTNPTKIWTNITRHVATHNSHKTRLATTENPDRGIAALGRDISRGATSEELHLWSRLGYARGHVYGTSVLEPKASPVLEPEAIEDT